MAAPTTAATPAAVTSPSASRFWLLAAAAACAAGVIVCDVPLPSVDAVAVATLCYYMEPTIVLLLSPLVFRERLGVKKALCAAAAVAGMVLVSGVTGSGGGDLRGILFGLGAALFYSAVVILNKKLPGVEAYAKTTVQLLSAAAVLAPYLLLTGGFSGVSTARSAMPAMPAKKYRHSAGKMLSR